jgi:hypothetical protein
MTQRDQAICTHCGHRFRTGADDTAPTDGPEPMNRTMQFSLPPLPPRTPLPTAPPPNQSLSILRVPGLTRSSLGPALLTALLVIALGAGVYWYSLSAHRPLPQDSSPMGAWETTLASRGGADAHLRFALASDGSGQFSWHETGPLTPSGQMPLHWSITADGSLLLTLSPSPGSDPTSGTLAAFFNSHPWVWHVDRTPHRLILGKLVLTEAL